MYKAEIVSFFFIYLCQTLKKWKMQQKLLSTKYVYFSTVSVDILVIVDSSTKYINAIRVNGPPQDKTNKMARVSSEDSDQPGHPPSLIRVIAVHIKKALVLTCSYTFSAQRRL